jgi:hypothetical protein
MAQRQHGMSESGSAGWSGYRPVSRETDSYAYMADEDGDVVEVEVVFPPTYGPGRRTKVMDAIREALATAVAPGAAGRD